MLGITYSIFRIFRSHKGQSAVEFALVVPVLLVLLMGFIDFGYLFYEFQAVENAARVAARSASLNLSDATAEDDGRKTLPPCLQAEGKAIFGFNPKSSSAKGRTSGGEVTVTVTWYPESLTGVFGEGKLIPFPFLSKTKPPKPVVIRQRVE